MVLVNSLLTSVTIFLPCSLCCAQSGASEAEREREESESLEDDGTERQCDIEVSSLREE